MAREIADRSGVSERKIRDDFVCLINDKVKELEDGGKIIGKKYGEGEDWLLVTSSLDLAFKIITHILDHSTEYKHYKKVPLEVGIGVGQYDKWAKLDGSKLIVETPTIEFLKTRIIDYYREWYKRTHSISIKSTFIVLTESAYNEMEPLDKEFCKKVEYEGVADMEKKSKASFFVAETEKVIQRGMLLDFLEKIKISASSWYRRIDRIFVPPNEYESIIECLEKHKVVFLVGDPEIGKTYTAIRILWEYCCKGYNPIWYSGSELDDRKKIRQMMSECKVSDHSVTYFEDPFGRIRFEDREELRRTIGSFLRKVQGLNSRVIITSREEVFKEFDKEKLSQSDLRAFTVEMRLMKPSYSKEKMEAILLDWAAEFDCKWLKSENLKSFVIAAGKKLITPLAVKDFALDSKDSDDLSVIDSLVREKSKEVKEAFAEEIANMNKEKVVFLSVVYILHLMETEKIRTIYDNTCNRLGLDSETNPFEYLINRFKSKISRDRQETGFEFTHSSYEEGFVSSWNRIEVKPFFLRITNELIKEDDPFVRGLCGFCLTKNFAEISFKEEAKKIIEAILHDKNANARNGVAEATCHYFNNIPMNLALENLETMANDRHRGIRASAIATIGENFKKISLQESLKFISRSLEDRAAWVRLQAIGGVEMNMEDLPEELVTKALERCKELCSYTGWLISFFASITYTSFKEKAQKLKDMHVTPHD